MDLVDRRSFLKRTGLTGGAVVAGSFERTLTTASSVLAAPRSAARPSALSTLVDSPYGPLAPVPDQNSDAILALPSGFSYVTFSKTGQR